MQPAPPAALQLARRLRQLRESRPRLTQKKLAAAFSLEEKVGGATVSSWESPTSPKLPPQSRRRPMPAFSPPRDQPKENRGCSRSAN